MSLRVKHKNIIMLSTADWDAPYKTNKQHMAFTMAKRGFRVLYVESPGMRKPILSSVKDRKRILMRLTRAVSGTRNVTKNIWVCSPLQIPFMHGNVVIKFLNSLLLRIQVQFHQKQIGFSEFILWSYHPYASTFKNVKGLTTSAYHLVDDLASVPDIDAQSYKSEERAFLRWVDYVFVTHKNLEENLRNQHSNILYSSNVVDVEHFRSGFVSNSPTDFPDDGKPVVGFHGVLSDFKIDFELLFTLASTRQDWNFVLIGDQREGQDNKVLARLKSLNNVYALGYKKYEVLPIYLAHFNVAIMPILQNEYTQSMFPMKYYEYIAACVPVVTTKSDFVNSLRHNISVGSDYHQVEILLEQCIRNGKYSIKQSDKMVGGNNWDQRFQLMLDFMGT